MISPWSWVRIGLCFGVCLAVSLTMAPVRAEESDFPKLQQSSEPEEESSWFWRWWEEDDAENPTDEETEEDRPWMFSSPFANITWPEITMPKIALRPAWGDEEGEGGWISTPFYRVRSAARGAIDRTRTAWNSAVDRMKFALPGGGEEETPQLANNDRSPKFWQRMFGNDDETTEPSSVGDLMAKESESTPQRVRR